MNPDAITGRLEFVGRSDLLGSLADSIDQSAQSVIIVGQPRGGKTALLRYIDTIGLNVSDPPSYVYVYVDATKFAESDFSALFWEALLAITKKRLKSNSGTNTAADPFQGLLDIVDQQNKKVVLLIDNIDIFSKVFTESDTRKIKEITDSEHNNQLFFIATGNNHPNKIIEQNKYVTINESPFYNFGLCYLLPLSLQETMLIADRLPIRLEQNEILYIYQMSGGYPGLLGIIIEYVTAERKINHGPLTDYGLQMLSYKILIDDRIVSLCKALYEGLLSSQKQFLVKLIGNAKTIAPDDSDYPIFLKLKDHLGFIRVENNQIMIFSEVFSRVIRRELTNENSSSLIPEQATLETSAPVWTESSFRYESDKGTIEKHGRKITLTKLENRLMSYFLAKPNQLCTHEELLTNLWSPKRSTRVIERAINRLREKVEDDPSVPQRIITVKGKGYMFNER